MGKDTRPFLAGTPTSFAKAFPNIGNFAIEVVQGDGVWGPSNTLGATRTYTNAAPPPPVIPCINRRCREGGLNIEAYVAQANDHLPWALKDTFRCNGHEGRQRRRCSNSFNVSMRFEPKQT